tara:strand:+ start:2801 stop:5656 length:2856 start_codon:yes stop_codon:yes gene_type:complete
MERSSGLSRPGILDVITQRYWQNYLVACETKDIPESVNIKSQSFQDNMMHIMAISDFAAKIFCLNPEWPIQCHEQSYPALRPATIRQSLKLIFQDEAIFEDVKQRVRLFRNKMMCLIMMRFILKKSDLSTHFYELSMVADLIVEMSTQYIKSKMKNDIGEPVTLTGDSIAFNIIALGKLGGQELNFSSDIDLIFSYSDKGEVKEVARPISVEQYFTRMGQSLIELLSAITEDGFVYRVDMRLRPYGNSGALVMHYDQLEQYYQYQGRDWERYAFVKARIVYGDFKSQKKLNNIIQPFVYRKYLDYSAFDALREMRSKIQLDVIKHKRQNDIKLGNGGIRQIEFFVQALQLIRGGKNPSLQKRHLLSAIEALSKIQAINDDVYNALRNGYEFFREFEHYIQFIRDEQTHLIPENSLDQARVAFAMHFDSWELLLAQLNKHRHIVSQYFNSLSDVSTNQTPQHIEQITYAKALWVNAEMMSGQPAAVTENFIDVLQKFKNSFAVRELKEKSRKRLNQIMPVVLDKIIQSSRPQVLLERLLKFFAAILRRSAYLTFLIEKDEALNYLLKVLEQSEWIAKNLSQYPVLLDDILVPLSISKIQSKSFWQESLNRELKELDDDLELQMEKLRQFKLSAYLNISLLEIFEQKEIGVSLALGYLVETILEKVYDICLKFVIETFQLPFENDNIAQHFPFAIVAYGKLGAGALSYQSDLDLVFLYLDEQMVPPSHDKIKTEVFVRFAQRIIHVLSTPMFSGTLFDVDVGLRPGGSAGMLVSSVSGYEKYLTTQAWTWEHQALVNARFLLGSEIIAQDFKVIRKNILCLKRDPEVLKKSICDMRDKMLINLACEEDSLKVTMGGMVDVEFIAQYGVLLLAHKHPALTQQYGTTHLLKMLGSYHFLPLKQIMVLSDAYGYYQKQQRLLLLKTGENENVIQLQEHQSEVAAIWGKLFEATGCC